MLVNNGCITVFGSVNMPSESEAIDCFIKHKVVFGPAKAANAGGVAVSGLDMSQKNIRLSWSFEEVDNKLHDIIVNIFRNGYEKTKEYGQNECDLKTGSDIAGIEKAADAMMAKGI